MGWHKGDPSGQQSTLSYYAGIYAGRLTQFASRFACEPADVLEAAEAAGVELFTDTENDDPHMRCISVRADDMDALDAKIKELR